MNLEHLHRDIGHLEGTVKALKEKVDGMDQKLDAVLARQYRFAGAVGVMSAIGSGLAAWLLK